MIMSGAQYGAWHITSVRCVLTIYIVIDKPYNLNWKNMCIIYINNYAHSKYILYMQEKNNVNMVYLNINQTFEIKLNIRRKKTVYLFSPNQAINASDEDEHVLSKTSFLDPHNPPTLFDPTGKVF